MMIRFSPIDPLKLLTQEVVFSQGKKEEEQHEEEEEEESKDKERLLEIWRSFSQNSREGGTPKPLVLKKPLLKAIAKELNSPTLQDKIYEKFLLAKYGSEKERQEGECLIQNLELINAKIDKANSQWYKKIPIPLVKRIFNVIERIKIPR